MTGPLQVHHSHLPLYRVVRRAWLDPLDSSYSRRQPDNRWNPPNAFPVFYTACSERVARAVTQERYQALGLEFDEIQSDWQPQLVEISWTGDVVDLASSEGITVAGFPPESPEEVEFHKTQPKALQWYASGEQGIVCRSASLARVRPNKDWSGSCASWGEVAIFTDNAGQAARVIRRRDDTEWLRITHYLRG
ncbi:MAG: RES family NAD+ phosphorylase [Dehalococcoidia bacterium]